jgi:hypothetical protein
MNPTKLQLRSLKLMLRQKSRPLTAMDLIKESWQNYTLTLALVTVAIAVSVLNGWTALAIFFGGYLAGIVERDFQWLRNQVKVLPLSSEITNWERVEQLVQENEPRAT